MKSNTGQQSGQCIHLRDQSCVYKCSNCLKYLRVMVRQIDALGFSFKEVAFEHGTEILGCSGEDMALGQGE